MEKVAGVRWTRSLGHCAALALGFIAACPQGWAQEAASSMQDRVLAQTRADQGFRLEVNSSTLPRLDAQDSGFQAPRVDLSLSPQGRGLGVVVGMSNFGLRSAVQPNNFASQPSMDLGLRWRQVVQSKQVDVMAWRRMTTDDDAYSLIQQRQPVYGARVEMKLGDGSKSMLNAAGGFLGFQLESGAKITVKRKDGRPMVYYRTAF
ncbi:MAG: hypothetical protein JWQ76_1429 [Ramlibacter sp.]|nr:hypothetical protein [Ramlibacter sp.]